MKMKAMNAAFQLDNRRGLHYVHLNVDAQIGGVNRLVAGHW